MVTWAAAKRPDKKLEKLSKLPAFNFLKKMGVAKVPAFANLGNANNQQARFIDENCGGPGVRLRQRKKQSK